MNAIEISKCREPEAEPLQRRTNPSPRILVVEDEPLIRRLNLEILTDAGYVVDAAEDGAAAWDALQLHRYDLLLTDNQMPKMSGLDLVIKTRDARMGLPVIMATGTLPDVKFTPSFRDSPFVVMLKPYSLVELVGTVKALLRSKLKSSKPAKLLPNWECQPLAFGVRLS